MWPRWLNRIRRQAPAQRAVSEPSAAVSLPARPRHDWEAVGRLRATTATFETAAGITPFAADITGRFEPPATLSPLAHDVRVAAPTGRVSNLAVPVSPGVAAATSSLPLLRSPDAGRSTNEPERVAARPESAAMGPGAADVQPEIAPTKTPAAPIVARTAPAVVAAAASVHTPQPPLPAIARRGLPVARSNVIPRSAEGATPATGPAVEVAPAEPRARSLAATTSSVPRSASRPLVSRPDRSSTEPAALGPSAESPQPPTPVATPRRPTRIGAPIQQSTQGPRARHRPSQQAASKPDIELAAAPAMPLARSADPSPPGIDSHAREPAGQPAVPERAGHDEAAGGQVVRARPPSGPSDVAPLLRERATRPLVGVRSLVPHGTADTRLGSPAMPEPPVPIAWPVSRHAGSGVPGEGVTREHRNPTPGPSPAGVSGLARASTDDAPAPRRPGIPAATTTAEVSSGWRRLVNRAVRKPDGSAADDPRPHSEILVAGQATQTAPAGTTATAKRGASVLRAATGAHTRPSTRPDTPLATTGAARPAGPASLLPDPVSPSGLSPALASPPSSTRLPVLRLAAAPPEAPTLTPIAGSLAGPVELARDAASQPQATPPPTSESGDDQAETDQLVRRLYPRIRDELRWELRVQRERAGLLADPL